MTGPPPPEATSTPTRWDADRGRDPGVPHPGPPAVRSGPASFLAAAALPFGPGLDHRQRDALSLLIDTHHPDVDHIAHADHVVRTLDITIGKLTDVDQSRVFQPDVHESTEVDHVQHGPLQLHPGDQILKLENALLEDGLGKIIAGITLGPAQGLDDVVEREITDSQLLGKLDHIGRGKLLVQFGKPVPVVDNLRGMPEPLEQASGDFIAFRVDPGSIKRIGPLEESSRTRLPE